MKAPVATVIIPDGRAREVMKTVPLVMRFIRMEMRSRRAPVLSVPQFRVLTFLSPRPGAPLSSVAEHLAVARSIASAMVNRLVRRELVRVAWGRGSHGGVTARVLGGGVTWWVDPGS
jgi:Flp pilus assembly CpaE family ATPase